MSALSFFIGKGGVGKTTVAAAYAVRAAAGKQHRSVLLLSTDPAHSLADIFQTRLGDSAKAISVGRRGELFVWQLNAKKRFRKFLAGHRQSILDLVEAGTIFTRSEIEPLLDTTLPGMAEFAALLAINDLAPSGRYSEIVVDTAPLGHTLRLFEMPEYFARFLAFLDLASSRDRILAERFGGVLPPGQPFVEEWRAIVAQIQRAFAGGNAHISMVTTPETFALNESARAAEALRQSAAGVVIASIVLNRAVTQPSGCVRCQKRRLTTRSALDFLARNFPRTPVLVAEENGGPILGINDLLGFGEHVFSRKKLRAATKPPEVPQLRFAKTRWPDLAGPLSFTLGKGGVGKTTISAGLAVRHRLTHPRQPLTICSTDPAPSLDDVFRQRIGNEPVAVLRDPHLHAMELDAVREFRAWTEHIGAHLHQAFTSEARGVHVELSFERRMIKALIDIVPPGVDEVFAIFRILDLLTRNGVVLIDMAPTGHALELLRMPDRMAQWARLLLKTLAPHRRLPLVQDAAVEIATIGQRVRELRARLRNARCARVWPVMLAELLPDRETRRLLTQLRDLGLQSAPLFVNRVVFAEDIGRCARCRRAHAWQMATLAKLRQESKDRVMYIVRDFSNEIAGARALKAFTRELWRIV